MSKTVLMLAAVAMHPVISFDAKIIFYIGFIMLFYLSIMHLGCQELVYKGKESISLAFAKTLCPRRDFIVVTRYFGVGTLVLYVIGFIMFVKYLHI